MARMASLRVSFRCGLDPGVLERVYFPVPFFFAQDDGAPGFLACGRRAASFDIESLYDCERNIRPNEAEFLDGVASCVVMEVASRA